MSTTIIDDLRQRLADLINLFDAYSKELDVFELQKTSVLKQERENRIFEKELDDKERQLYNERARIDEEKSFIEEANKKLAAKELSLSVNKEKLEAIDKATEEWERRKKIALVQEKIVDEKVKTLEEFNKRQKELDDQEGMIQKSNAVDAERKRILDIRQKQIERRESELQRIYDGLNK